MTRSLLSSFVNGTRQMLALQLFVSVGAIALAGYTVAVTNNAIRERDRLAERVIQLEDALGQAGVAPPQIAPLPQQPAETLYPPSLEQSTEVTPAPEDQDAEAAPETEPQQPIEVVQQPTEPPPRSEPQPTPQTETPPRQNADADPAPPRTETPTFDPTQILRELLTPPPPLRTVVLHVRSENDVGEAQRVARQLAANGALNVSIDIMPPGDQRQSGYAYFHGRQSRPAADVIQRLQEAARAAEIAAWSVQLRGAALPASGEYTADRLDIVLPPLPATPQQVNPQILRESLRRAPQLEQTPQALVIR